MAKTWHMQSTTFYHLMQFMDGLIVGAAYLFIAFASVKIMRKTREQCDLVRSAHVEAIYRQVSIMIAFLFFSRFL